MMSTRYCSQPMYGGQDCLGVSEKEAACNKKSGKSYVTIQILLLLTVGNHVLRSKKAFCASEANSFWDSKSR